MITGLQGRDSLSGCFHGDLLALSLHADGGGMRLLAPGLCR